MSTSGTLRTRYLPRVNRNRECVIGTCSSFIRTITEGLKTMAQWKLLRNITVWNFCYAT